MTGQGGADGVPPVQGRSTESGKSRLLVSEALAAPSTSATALPPAPVSGFPSAAALFRVTSAFTGESLARQLRRTVVPLPPEFLSGVDAQGHPVEPDVEEVEKRMSLYSLLIEYSCCPQYAPEGVYCMPSWDNLRVWHGVIFLRHGLYRGGVFKFKLTIGEEYPRQAPTLQFLSRVYHVLVNPETGVLNLQVLFPQWQIDDYLSMLLMYLKSIFFRQEFLQGTTDEAQWRNLEAAKAMQEDKKKMLEEVRRCVKESQQQLYSSTAGADFIFDFHAFHREHKPIFNALTVLAHDATCVDPTEAFLEWFLEDYCRSEFQEASSAASRGGGSPGQAAAGTRAQAATAAAKKRSDEDGDKGDTAMGNSGAQIKEEEGSRGSAREKETEEEEDVFEREERKSGSQKEVAVDEDKEQKEEQEKEKEKEKKSTDDEEKEKEGEGKA